MAGPARWPVRESPIESVSGAAIETDAGSRGRQREPRKYGRLLGSRQRNEPSSWERAALAVRERLVSVAFRVVRDDGDAADAADEAIARLAEVMDRGERVEVEPWLVRTALRLAIDRARAVARRARLARDVARRGAESSAGDGAGAMGEDPAGALLRVEARERVWQELLELPEKRQRVVVLRDMEGLAFAEIARLLGIRESTARVHAMEGREELRRRLARYRRECEE